MIVSAFVIQPKIHECFGLWCLWRYGMILTLACVCVQTSSMPDSFGLFMWKFLKSNGFCKVWGKLFEALTWKLFSTHSLSWGLKRVNVAFYLLGLFSILFLDIKVTCNCYSNWILEEWQWFTSVGKVLLKSGMYLLQLFGLSNIRPSLDVTE